MSNGEIGTSGILTFGMGREGAGAGMFADNGARLGVALDGNAIMFSGFGVIIFLAFGLGVGICVIVGRFGVTARRMLKALSMLGIGVVETACPRSMPFAGATLGFGGAEKS
jgi:hypothetical protein